MTEGSLDDPCHSFHPWVLIISVIVAVGGGGLAENWIAIGYSVNRRGHMAICLANRRPNSATNKQNRSKLSVK